VSLIGNQLINTEEGGDGHGEETAADGSEKNREPATQVLKARMREVWLRGVEHAGYMTTTASRYLFHIALFFFCFSKQD